MVGTSIEPLNFYCVSGFQLGLASGVVWELVSVTQSAGMPTCLRPVQVLGATTVVSGGPCLTGVFSPQ